MLGVVKVSDLGILRQIEPELEVGDDCGDNTAMHRAQTFVGTTTYMAPERIDGQEYSYSSDIWSFGLALLTVALGRLPLETTGGFWQVLQSVRDKPSPTVPDNGQWSGDFRSFIALCLKKDPEERPSASVLLKHPFLSQAFVEEHEDIANIGAEELRAIVKALYSHVDLLRNDSLKMSTAGQNAIIELERNESVSGKYPYSPLSEGKSEEKGNLISSMEMTKLLLFGEPLNVAADGRQSVESVSSPRPHRLKVLAEQLHIPLPMAIQIARKTLLNYSSSDVIDVATPKATHSHIK